LAAFANHIGNVVLLRSEKQMLWVNTPPVVAVMADIEAVRNGCSVMQFVREAVHQMRSAIDAHHAVAVRRFVSSPKPAATRFLHSFPKALNAVVAPAFLELSATALRVPHSDVMVVREANRLEGSKVKRRDHRSAPTRTGDARHRQHFGLSFLMTRNLIWSSWHMSIIPTFCPQVSFV
jgi:hypothetical protein